MQSCYVVIVFNVLRHRVEREEPNSFPKTLQIYKKKCLLQRNSDDFYHLFFFFSRMKRNIDHFHQVGNVYYTISVGVAVGEIEITHRQLQDVVHYRHHVNYVNKTVVVDIAKK